VPTIGNVVKCGACVGCGACSVITNRQIPMAVDPYGVWQADPTVALPLALELGSRVCPFADESPNETEISSEDYGHLPLDPRVGRYLDAFAAQVNDDEYLAGSSSGGVTSWMLKQLLERDLIDGVIHVGADPAVGLFSYVVSRTPEDLVSRRKSIYYSTSMADALLTIKGNGKRYALVGVPCFITAGRLLARNDEQLNSQLRFFLGLVCGHLKSAAFAELLAWQLGIPPEEVAAVDFRVKDPSRNAASYDFEAVTTRGEIRKAPSGSLLGGNWGHGLFQLDSCNFCDDIFAETADIVFGDAWLPEFVEDWRGHNVVVTRHLTLARIIDDGVSAGAISFRPLGPERAADSQAGTFRHRREGLMLRLHDDHSAGRWTPRKRVAPSTDIPRQRKAVVRARRVLSAESHGLFRNAVESHSLERFFTDIRPLIDAYNKISRASILRRSARSLRSRASRSAPEWARHADRHFRRRFPRT
jgi:coenzyme F420 hydrogenase subunit beta